MKSKKLHLLILIFIAFLFLFYNFSRRKIEVWDEYTNFNVVYDTIDSDSFPLLTLRNEYFLEKPPLWYWLTIFSTNIFGINNFSLRFISALSGSFLIIPTYFLGKKLFSHKIGIFASLVLLSIRQLFIVNTSLFSTHLIRSGDLDSLQILLLLLTTFSFVKFHENKSNYFWMVASAIFTSFGFLTKGPFSLIPISLYILFYILNKKLIIRDRFLLNVLIFTVAFLVITFPWHIFMYLKFRDEFINEYFLYHMIKRGFSTIEEHYGDILYYIRILLRKDFYFSGEVLIISFIYFIKKHKKKIISNFKLFTTLSTSIAFFIIPTLIQTKLVWYILPFYPYSSIILGKFIGDLSKNNKNPIIKLIIILVVGIIVINSILIFCDISSIKAPENIM